MKKQLLTTFILSLAVLCKGQTSNFDINDQGWTLEGDPTSITPFHNLTGGNPDGFCNYIDQNTGLFIYWVAPANYLGNKSASFGQYLRFDLKQNLLTDQRFNRGDVILQGGGITIYFNDTSTFNNGNPDTIWTHYDVPLWDTLTVGYWERNSFSSGIPVSNSDFQTVLNSLTFLKIRGEFCGDPDIGSIDNVTLEPNTTGILDITNTRPFFHFYPNPSKNILVVEFTKAARITIFNAYGDDVEDKIIKSNSQNMVTFNVSHLPNGIYLLKVDNNTETFIKQ